MKLSAYTFVILATFVNSMNAGVSHGESMMDYLASRPELSCDAIGSFFNETFIIVKCPANCTEGTAFGGDIVNGERIYHSFSQICYAALHAQILTDANRWLGLRKEPLRDYYDVIQREPHVLSPLKFTDTWDGILPTGWSIVPVSVAGAKRPLHTGNKVSCNDGAIAFLMKNKYMTVECPPGCYVTPAAKFNIELYTDTSAYDSICQAAVLQERITVAGGLVRYHRYQTRPNDPLIIFADLSYDCVNAVKNNMTIDAAQDDGSGVYWVCADGPRTCYKTYCDNSLTSDSGWMTIQRRVNSTMDFYKDWVSYEYGFGDLGKEFWFGLAPLRDFVATGPYELNITMTDTKGNTKYAHYDSFSIGPAIKDYPLYVSGYSGTAGDSLSCSNLAPFSTYDHNSGVYAHLACPKKLRGGWWYTNCGESDLNGDFTSLGSSKDYQTAVAQLYWYSWMFPMESVELKIRKKSG